MLNVYATSGHFKKAMQERISMKKKQIEKQPGCSSIEVDGEVHEFVAGSRLHTRIQEIYCISNNLSSMLQQEQLVLGSDSVTISEHMAF